MKCNYSKLYLLSNTDYLHVVSMSNKLDVWKTIINHHNIMKIIQKRWKRSSSSPVYFSGYTFYVCMGHNILSRWASGHLASVQPCAGRVKKKKCKATARPYVFHCSDCPCQWSNQRGRPPIKYLPSYWGDQIGSHTSCRVSIISGRGVGETHQPYKGNYKCGTDEGFLSHVANVGIMLGSAPRGADYNRVNNVHLTAFLQKILLKVPFHALGNRNRIPFAYKLLQPKQRS